MITPVENFKEYMASADDVARLVLANAKLGLRIDSDISKRCIARFQAAGAPVRILVDKLENAASPASGASAFQEFVAGNPKAGNEAAEEHEEVSAPRG